MATQCATAVQTVTVYVPVFQTKTQNACGRCGTGLKFCQDCYSRSQVCRECYCPGCLRCIYAPAPKRNVTITAVLNPPTPPTPPTSMGNGSGFGGTPSSRGLAKAERWSAILCGIAIAVAFLGALIFIYSGFDARTVLAFWPLLVVGGVAGGLGAGFSRVGVECVVSIVFGAVIGIVLGLLLAAVIALVSGESYLTVAWWTSLVACIFCGLASADFD